MEDVIDLIATDGAAKDVSSNLKDLLFAKSAEKIEALRPGFSGAMFDEPKVEVETEPEQEVTQDSEE